jgi:hypothetical protein
MRQVLDLIGAQPLTAGAAALWRGGIPEFHPRLVRIFAVA